MRDGKAVAETKYREPMKMAEIWNLLVRTSRAEMHG